ncbi:MAG: zf-HC2 domain-containing protein [Anaerolineae bacterium]|nr:zf-HC2 domain-containing protein [Candidatus Roseilinea sp.]MDW8448925.1 zf-HC2 domain-containing protein [Anaerolineae bacterium]
MATEPVTCSCPPALTEDELEAALSGVGDAAVEAHLVQCAYCSARLAAMRRFERTLQARLARQGCPNVSVLGDYALGLLDAEGDRRLEAHLTTCVRCAQELRVIREVLLEQKAARPAQHPDAEPTRAGNRLARLMAGLQRTIASLLPMEPRLALRGNERTTRILAATARERIFLEATSHGDRQQLTGQVLSEDSGIWDGAFVEVYHGDDLAAVSVLDDMGEFACDGLTAPHMRVMITAIDGRQIVIPDLRFDA